MWALWALWAQEASAAPWRATSSSGSFTHIYRNHLRMLCSGPTMSTVWRIPSHIACPLQQHCVIRILNVVTQAINMGHSLTFFYRYCLSLVLPGYCPTSCLENFTGAMCHLSLQTISWLIYSTHHYNSMSMHIFICFSIFLIEWVVEEFGQ